MKETLFRLIATVSGQAYSPLWEEKFPLILSGIIAAMFVFCFITTWLFRASRGDAASRKFILIVVGVILGVLCGKYLIAHFFHGYIPDRWFFYGIPSPKMREPWWLMGSMSIFAFFVFFRERLLTLPRHVFLACLLGFFVFFSVTTAGIREGVTSITDSLSRTKWEYTGNVPLIKSTKQFLHDYISLQPQLAHHAITHPPGYSVMTYYLEKITPGGFFGIAIGIVILAGFTLWPLYYFLRYFFQEETVRNTLSLFLFFPGLVLMSATSLDATFLFWIWLAIVLFFFGWLRSVGLSLLGGVVAGIALLSNFLFLLLGPFFLFLLWHVFKKISVENRKHFFLRVGATLFSAVGFFVFLYVWAEYSIIENFFVAKAANHGSVESNFVSLGRYVTYAVVNSFDILVALGIGTSVLLFPRLRSFFVRKDRMIGVGFCVILFFILIGVFQGELARLWLFVTPFFLLPLGEAIEGWGRQRMSLFLGVLFLQTVMMELLFYMHW